MKRFLVICAILLSGVVLWDQFPSSRELVPSSAELADGYEDIGYLPNLYVAYVASDGRMFGIEDHFLYVSEDQGRSFRQLGVLPKFNSTWRDWLSNRIARSKFVRAVRRNPGPNNLVVLSSGTILVFYDHIYRSTDNGSSFHPIVELDSLHLEGPFPYGEGIGVGADDTVYYGEYTTAVRPHEVRIVEGTRDGTEWKIVYTFPSGEVFHVHGIQYDPYRHCYWITTGDRGSEPKVLHTQDGFKSLHLLGGGSQDWRVVSLMITKENLFWGSDNDNGPASIFRWNFEKAQLTRLQEIGKPSYYSTILDDGMLVLSTTYEPQSEYTRMYKPDATTDLWVSQNGVDWVKLLSLPYKQEQLDWGLSRASIAFSSGIRSHDLMLFSVSTEGDRFLTRVIHPRLSPYKAVPSLSH